MAVVSRVANIRIEDTTLGGFREWTATATTQDTAAGSSVAINIATSTGGVNAPGTANTARELRFETTSGSVIRTFTWSEGAASTSHTFHFTSNGQSGASARCGTLRMVLRVTKTNGGPTETYDVESDGSPNTPPSGRTTTQADVGWIRGTTTATVAVSNQSLGGGKTEPAVFGESVFARTVLGAVSYQSRALTVAATGTSKSRSSSSTTSVTRDVTFSGTSTSQGRVNEGFPAADGTYTFTIATPVIDGTTAQPWTVLTSITTDTLNVDPRLTAVHLFQLDDNSFGTPPLSKLEASGERPASSIGYFATGFHDARGGVAGDVMSGGVTGLTADFTLTASNGTVVSRTSTTTTEGGEDGWTSGFMQWTNGLPGGTWNKTVDITSPSDIDHADYLLNSTAAYVLIASSNPFVAIVVDAGHSGSDANDRHMHKGDGFEVGAFLEYTKATEERLLEADAGTTPQVAIKRIRNSMVEYWDGSQFVVANPDIGFLPMTQASTYVWTYTTTSDDDWSDVVVQVAGLYLGVSYSGQTTREFVGKNKRHDDALVASLLWIPTANRDTHWGPGDPVVLSFTLFDPSGADAPDWDSDPEIAVIRLTAALGLEYLDADLETWVAYTDLSSAWLTSTDGTLTLADTSTFDTGDLILVARGFVHGGEPYSALRVVEVVGAANPHDSYSFDGAGFVGFPSK